MSTALTAAMLLIVGGGGEINALDALKNRLNSPLADGEGVVGAIEWHATVSRLAPSLEDRRRGMAHHALLLAAAEDLPVQPTEKPIWWHNIEHEDTHQTLTTQLAVDSPTGAARLIRNGLATSHVWTGSELVRWFFADDGSCNADRFPGNGLSAVFVGSAGVWLQIVEQTAIVIEFAEKNSSVALSDDSVHIILDGTTTGLIERLNGLPVQNGFMPAPGYAEVSYENLGADRALLEAKWYDSLGELLIYSRMEWNDDAHFPSLMSQDQYIPGSGFVHREMKCSGSRRKLSDLSSISLAAIPAGSMVYDRRAADIKPQPMGKGGVLPEKDDERVFESIAQKATESPVQPEGTLLSPGVEDPQDNSTRYGWLAGIGVCIFAVIVLLRRGQN